MYSEKIKELEVFLKNYLFFWNEWISNGNCNLSLMEIATANKYIENNFDTDFVDRDSILEEISRVNDVLRKLDFGYQIFKDFVIVNFLHKILVMAKEYGYDSFLTSPIRNLNLDKDLKECLSKFKTHNLQLAFIIYKPEDFNRKTLFNIIKEFQLTYKHKNEYSLLKP